MSRGTDRIRMGRRSGRELWSRCSAWECQVRSLEGRDYAVVVAHRSAYDPALYSGDVCFFHPQSKMPMAKCGEVLVLRGSRNARQLAWI